MQIAPEAAALLLPNHDQALACTLQVGCEPRRVDGDPDLERQSIE
jgi:hypothetical protein